ncbi:acetyl-CoA C-acyltransferase [Microbacterium sp. ANT_H45B]|uniref:acetyl-CoA C-acyltransferase n=1 Tax=Microbacterium sp. ANT_H45B TaxID=2597346 RepID=UPI0011ECA479|nr:acetyl-CoA C-acyltransferase [Microbacterium sp. ANT_H45B]KAA0962485.1 acetyl-CoA C-acyltransferase [Microbacterium sp. ANT_H45B]
MVQHPAPDDAVIVAYHRTPFGRARKGSLATERPEDLALVAIRATLASVPQLSSADLDDFYLGTAVPERAQGDNIARRVAVLAGLDRLPAATVNRFCASSLQAAAMAAQAIRAGDADTVLVGGVESTSSTPPLTASPYPGSETAEARADHLFNKGETWTDPREHGLVPDVYITTGKTAEFVAQITGTSRRDQDEWALASHQRAIRARDNGFYDREITPVKRRDGVIVSTDDGPRPSTSLEILSGLPAAFREHGSVTAGNSSPLNDGASAAIITSASYARAHGITPLARILGSSASGLSPEIMGLGPVEATRKLLKRLGMTLRDFDLIELNEAFAAQVVPVVRQLEADPERVNVHGGAIALGHPFGATGVRLLGTLTYGLHDRDGHLGLATLCVGGGQGMALAIERLQ